MNGFAPACVRASAEMSKTHTSATVAQASARDVNITLSGEANKWYGVAFGPGSWRMQGYAIIVDEKGTVHERSLKSVGNPGHTDLNSSAKVVSSHVVGGVRTVVLSRGMAGVSSEYYSFTAADLTKGINVSSAAGAIWPNMHFQTDTAMLKPPHSTPTPAPTLAPVPPGAPTSGSVEMEATGVALAMKMDGSDLEITLTGDATKWIGAGFGSGVKQMNGYAIVIDESGGLHELDMSGPGAPGGDVVPTAHIVSQHTTGQVRSTVLKRPMKGGSFNFDQASLVSGLLVSSALGSTWKHEHSVTDTATFKFGQSSRSDSDTKKYYQAHGSLMTI